MVLLAAVQAKMKVFRTLLLTMATPTAGVRSFLNCLPLRGTTQDTYVWTQKWIDKLSASGTLSKWRVRDPCFLGLRDRDPAPGDAVPRKIDKDTLDYLIAEKYVQQKVVEVRASDFSDLRVPIAEGAAGKVYEYGEDQVIKVFTHELHNEREFLREERMLNKIGGNEKLRSCPYILGKTNYGQGIEVLKTHWADVKLYAIAMPRCAGDLGDYVDEARGKMPDPEYIGQLMGFLVNALEGLSRLHEANIVHNDIKLDNLLLSSDRTSCLIADFGLATAEGDREYHGTYLPPEARERKGKGLTPIRYPSLDVWCLSVAFLQAIDLKLSEDGDIQSTWAQPQKYKDIPGFEKFYNVLKEMHNPIASKRMGVNVALHRAREAMNQSI